MNVPRILVAGLGALWVSACVTINVYFPAAAAEQAAETIVREVVGEQPPAGKPEPQSETDRQSRSALQGWRAWAVGVLDWIAPPAAAKANLEIDTPAIRKLRASLKRRQPQLRPYFASGALGLTRDGLVALRDAKAVPLKERSRVKKLVADENRDRNALYREIARANGHPEWEDEIRKTFAKVWVKEFPKGTWYQDAKGAWRRK